jgi:type IV secretory pathway TrbF-like protein
VGSVVAEKQTWKMVGLISLMIVMGTVGGLIYLANQSKYIPYIVAVDKLGQSVAVGPAPMAQTADPRVVEATIAAWITNARTVSPDVALERKAIFSVYALIGPHDAAAQKMNDWLNGTEESNPFVRAEKVTVDVQINSVLQQTPETWEVDWTESTRDRQGVLTGPAVPMRALVTVYYVAPTAATTDEKMRMNPIGLYVRDFSWGKQI